MACKCPVCRKPTAHVGTLFSHIMSNYGDSRHDTWLDAYCKDNGINLGVLLEEEREGAARSLTDLLKKDFCTGD